jgi:hypothetical protein
MEITALLYTTLMQVVKGAPNTRGKLAAGGSAALTLVLILVALHAATAAATVQYMIAAS